MIHFDRVDRSALYERAPRTAACFALALSALALAPRLEGSGFSLTDRGVRPMGRAGAFVAGADDAHAIWYNPAGLVSARNGVLFDLTYIGYDNAYTRQSRPDPMGDVVDYPTTSASTVPFMIPTLVLTHDFNQRNFMFAAGLFAPNAVITSYPDQPLSPQRYSLVNLNGSMLAIAGVWAAYAPSERFSAGLGVQALTGSFASRIVLSGCPATITCQPEDPEWDATAQLRVGPIFAPSANFGVRWSPVRFITLGLSGQLPFWINAPATLAVRLPSAAFYDGAMVRGERATVGFTLAPIVRAGVEVRPTPHDRIEAAFVFEGWALHDQISLTPLRDESQPNGIQIVNARGVGTYDVGPTAIQRGFQHAFSVRVGYERDQTLGSSGWHFFPRVGLSYDTSATAPEYTSVLTQDANKFIISLGASVGNDRWRFDVMYLHAFTQTVLVAPEDGRISQVRAFRANDQVPSYAINGGRYDMALNLFGIGLRYRF